MSRRSRKRAKRWVVYQLARFAAGLIALLPYGLALWLGRNIGRVAAMLDGKGRRRAEQQLAERLDLDEREAKQKAREVYENIGMVAIEIAMMPRLIAKLPDVVALPEEDQRILEAAVAEKRGVIFVTGHVGNWELLAQRVIGAGHDGVTLARKSPNPFLGDWIVRRRALGGLTTINRGDKRAAREMLSAMKRGALLGVLLDQATNVPSVDVPFFGAPAKTPVAAAELALRRGAPIVMGFIRRGANPTQHEVRLERLEFEPGDGPKEERVRNVTALLTERIETAVRAAPAEWVWFHDRWRR